MKAVKNVVLVILIISLIVATALLIRNNSVNALAQDVSNLQSDTNIETIEGLGDVNDGEELPDGSIQIGDGDVNAMDASKILIIAAEMDYAKINNISYELDEEIKNRADVNMDGNIDHIDASFVLKYGAERGASTTDKDFADWIKEKTTEEQSN